MVDQQPRRIAQRVESILAIAALALLALLPTAESLSLRVFGWTFYGSSSYVKHLVLWIAFLGNAYFVGTKELPWTAVLATAVNVGILCGFAINLGHELGHKKSKLERDLATSVLAMGAYGHFAIDHNRGHHRYVATPEDCASSRMGETLYAFAVRELPGAFRRFFFAITKCLR